jgi:hypothetical protein
MPRVFWANSDPVDRPQQWFIDDDPLTPPGVIAPRTPLPNRLQEITLGQSVCGYKERELREIRPKSERLESVNPI